MKGGFIGRLKRIFDLVIGAIPTASPIAIFIQTQALLKSAIHLFIALW